MGATQDQSSYSAALKVLYNGQTITDQTLTKNPLWGMVPKEQDFYGSTHPVPVNTQMAVVSNTFSYAQSDAYASSPRTFQVTRAEYFSVAKIEHHVMLASKKDIGAFAPAAAFSVDKSMQAVTKAIARDMYRGGTGSIGVIDSSGVSTGVFTLTNPTDAKFFSYGQVLQATNGDGGTPRAGIGYVLAVNYASGAITVASDAVGGAAATPSAWAAGDYIVPRGSNNLSMTGLIGWCPTTAPTSSLFGVARSEDPVGLGGYRHDGSSLSIAEAITTGTTQLAAYGGQPSHGFINNRWFGGLVNQLGTKVNYVPVQDPTGKIGFRALELYCDNSTIKVLSDPNCQPAKFWGLTMSSWCLRSLGMAPDLFDVGNGEVISVYNAMAAEVRVYGYLNLECDAPGWNLNETLASSV